MQNKFGIAHRHMLVHFIQGNLYDTTLHIHCLYTSPIHLCHLHLKDRNRLHTHLERFYDVVVPRQPLERFLLDELQGHFHVL